MEAYSAFYPSRPFWAVSEVDFTRPKTGNWLEEQMSEVVYEKVGTAFKLKICRDGQILIRVAQLAQREDLLSREDNFKIEEFSALIGEQLKYLNCFYLLLDSALIEISALSYFNLHEITRRDSFRITFDNGRFGGQGIASESITSTFQMARYQSSHSSALPIEYGPIFLGRRVISQEVLTLAGENFAKAFENQQLVKQLSSYTKALAEYKNGSYGTAIVLSWFITEYIINELWREKLNTLNITNTDGGKRINRDRMDFLTGNSFSAATTSHLLELFEQIQPATLEKLESVRKNRNKLVHQGSFKPVANDASEALELAKEMIGIHWKFFFTPNFGYSINW